MNTTNGKLTKVKGSYDTRFLNKTVQKLNSEKRRIAQYRRKILIYKRFELELPLARKLLLMKQTTHKRD